MITDFTTGTNADKRGHTCSWCALLKMFLISACVGDGDYFFITKTDAVRAGMVKVEVAASKALVLTTGSTLLT